jgi:hypothetical protein
LTLGLTVTVKGRFLDSKPKDNSFDKGTDLQICKTAPFPSIRMSATIKSKQAEIRGFFERRLDSEKPKSDSPRERNVPVAGYGCSSLPGSDPGCGLSQDRHPFKKLHHQKNEN